MFTLKFLLNFQNLKSIFIKHFSYFVIFTYSVLIFALMYKINIFRYEDFGQGKFDLGNMTQMAWYSLRGKFMYLTDYFGSNVPRWSMSHVDPILVLFLPIFYFFPHPLTLVFSQNFLVILGAFLIFEISKLKTKNEWFSLFLALGYLTFPAVGFVLAWTGYHGVTPAIFFFLLFVFYYEKKVSEGRSLKINDYLILIVLMTITMSGKEQISLYFIMFGIYIFLTSKFKKFGFSVSLYSLTWFLVCFLVIIPHYASYRIDSFEKFVNEMGINKDDVPNIYSSNYFLSRYSEFGDSYFEIVTAMVLNPVKTSSIFLTGDKLDNMVNTFGPVLYLNFLHPLMMLVAFPDLLINYSTTQGGIGTSEIYNHRISMIIPVVFLSVAYGIGFLRRFLSNFFYDKYLNIFITIIGIFIYFNNLYFSAYGDQINPLFAWFSESVSKKVLAKSDTKVIKSNLNVGEGVVLSPYIENDRGCVRKILDIIPPQVSVSGPDFLGSHLAQRETYAIFPAGKSSSEYLIVDIFSKKLLTILGLSYSLNRDFIEDVFKSKNYNLIYSCSNLMVFKKSDHNIVDTEKLHLLPIQMYNNYQPKFSHEVFQGVSIVDFNFDSQVKAGEYLKLRNVYQRNDSSDLSEYKIFTTLINKDSGDMYQFVNPPSTVFKTLDEFKKGKFYEEKLEVRIPEYLERGKYMIFVGLDNRLKTRSVYLGETVIK
jgi:uncharacterized membrane protein